MAFLLYQAKETGCLTPYQSEYLWKQISLKGWRTREPVETDFPHENPTLFPRILTIHVEDLNYGVKEFAELFHLEANDLRQLYGLQEAIQQRSFLHIIK
jgi:hypothetical protein